MTQKQTDYDKAFDECNKESKERFDFYNFDALHFAFRKGYEYGRKQSAADHERNLIALGDDYMTTRERAIDKQFKEWYDNIDPHNTTFQESYLQGWNDSDAFDDEWTAQHPKELLDRLLDSHPKIIEEVKREAVQEYRGNYSNASKSMPLDHFRDSTKKLRAEIVMRAMQALIHSYGDRGYKWISENAVGYADALIKELEKEE